MNTMRLTAYWSARLMVCVYVLASALGALCDQRASLGALVATTGWFGWLALSSLSVAAFVGVMDVVINDFMPSRFTFPAVYERRHILYMLIALGSVSMSGVVAMSEGWSIMLIKYWLDAGAACSIAFLEMFARHQGPFRE